MCVTEIITLTDGGSGGGKERVSNFISVLLPVVLYGYIRAWKERDNVSE